MLLLAARKVCGIALGRGLLCECYIPKFEGPFEPPAMKGTTQIPTDVPSSGHSKLLKTSTTESPPKKKPSKSMATGTTREAALQKKVPRRSSKPIINWLQRKLAGTSKAKRTENHPLVVSQLGVAGSTPGTNRQMGRMASSPLPVQQVKQIGKTDGASGPKKKARSISLNGDDELREMRHPSHAGEDDASDQLSLNRDSIWSPTSALEADDDASVRPLPPSSPPSPSPSRDSSSYLSDPRTFRSMTASTKPTTLLSIDLNGGGMAHIAQVPPSPAQFHRFTPQGRPSSLSSTGVLNSAVSFSAVPNPPTSSRPSSLRVNPNDLSPGNNTVAPVQAPLHTTPHPRNNPRPSSPPLDNASVLTLASSAFGLPNRPGMVPYTPSTTIGDSISHYGGSVIFPDAESTSQYVIGDDERLEERDIDASVRALRPRSSRRGSWESEASRWSARVHGAARTSFVREKGLRASGSIRTGAFSTDNAETLDDRTPETATREVESDKDSVVEPEPEDDNIVAVSDAVPKIDTQDGPLPHRSSIDTIGLQPFSESPIPA